MQLELFSPADLTAPPTRLGSGARPVRRGEALPWLLTSWPAFRLGRIPVQFHFSCAIYPVGYLLWVNRDVGWLANVTEVSILVALFWGSLLAHEWAHIVAARRQGVWAQGITFMPIGAMAQLDSMPHGAGEFWIALAGPVGSFLLAAIFWVICLLMPGPYESGWLELARVSHFLVRINLAFSVFNLLPCYPMDGGRMFRAGLTLALARYHPNLRAQAHALASRITVRYLVPVVVLAAVTVTIVRTHIWIHLGLFPLLWLAAELEYRVSRESDGHCIT